MNWTVIFEEIKKQGIAFVLLAAFGYFIYGQWHSAQLKLETQQINWQNNANQRIEALEKAVKECNENNLDLLINQINKNNTILEQYEKNHRK